MTRMGQDDADDGGAGDDDDDASTVSTYDEPKHT